VNIPRNIYSDSFLEEARVVYRIVGSKNTLETFIFPWRYVPENFLETDFIRSRANVSDFVFIDIDEVGKTMTVPSGKWIVGNDIVFPNDFDILIEAGVEIDLVNDSMLLFYSGVEFAGEEDNKIRVFSSDGTGQGISVLSAKSVSKISHVVFENFSAPSKSGWELSGGVNFYESDIEFVDVEFVGMNTEDSLNLVKSNFYMDGGIFRDCFSDCFDNDFGTGTISDSYFVNCGNDCLDFSGSEIVVNNVTLENIGDKGISAGENSVVSARDIVVSGNFTFIAFASKDFSSLFLTNVEINNAEYGFVAYEKKAEFGPSNIVVDGVVFSSVDNEYFIEKESKLKLNDIIVLGSEKNVYEKLYG